MISAIVIGFVYSVIQLVLSVCHALKGHGHRGDGGLRFDFYGDSVNIITYICCILSFACIYVLVPTGFSILFDLVMADINYENDQSLNRGSFYIDYSVLISHRCRCGIWSNERFEDSL